MLLDRLAIELACFSIHPPIMLDTIQQLPYENLLDDLNVV